MPRCRSLLVADLDGTLIGDSAATQRLLDIHHRLGGALGLAIATGRSRTSALEVLKSCGFEPDLLAGLATSVGTELYLDGGRTLDPDYWAPFEEGWSPSAVREALDPLAGLVPQPEEDQRRFKVSYFVRDVPSVAERVCLQLSAAGLHVTTVFSQEQYLDVLPLGMSKGSAAKYLADLLGLPQQAVMAAGDSGNDEAMLLSGCQATVVANHKPELEHLILSPGVYFAKAPYADGVLEGLRHWGLIPNAR